MRLDGRHAQEELVRDRRQALAGGDQAEDLRLPRGQDGGVVRRSQADLRGEARGELRRQHRLAAGTREHSVDDLLAAGVLGDVAADADLERVVDEGAVGEGRDEEDAGRQPVANHRVGDLDAVELRQAVVEQRDVGQVLLDRLERRPPVLRLGNDLHLAARDERTHDAVAVERVVVRNDDAHPLGVLRHPGHSRTEDSGDRGAARSAAWKAADRPPGPRSEEGFFLRMGARQPPVAEKCW